MLKFLNRSRNKKRGFTLIELIVVIAILAVLAAILVPSMLNVLEDSKQSVANANARAVYSAAQSAYVSITSTSTAPLADTYDSTVAEDAATAFMTKVASNLGTSFAGDYTVTVDGNGVTEVSYDDANGETGTYPAA